MNLGLNSKLKGFVYTKEAIYLYANTRIVNSVCKEIYTQIAHKYSVTTTSIGRAIRKSIEDSWYEAKLNVSHDLFKYSYIKLDYLPTNLEFIATMAELIKLSIKKELFYNL
ncbi:MAG: hypothetical protein IJN57_02465 [Oscillospiraceae bacterium]|nr:hypothetical protein [Oscillospiraceae bacterium]